MLAWCANYLADGYLFQLKAEQVFESSLLESSPAADPQAPVPGGSVSADERPAPPERGATIARISIPKVDISTIVLHGTDDITLKRGPGHLENSALPGETGNAVVAGHRDTVFRPLRNIMVGDDIYAETASGRFHYRVQWMRIVKPQDVSVVYPTDEPTLTLITCFPFFFVGNAPERFIVRAVGVHEPADAPFVPAIARIFEPYPTPAAPQRADVTPVSSGTASPKPPDNGKSPAGEEARKQ